MAFDGLDFRWTAEVFGTHNDHMDEEHRGLFTAIDALDRERTAASFEHLAGLVIQHFKDEETLGLGDAHLQQHKDLLAIAVAKLGELKSGAAQVDEGLVTYLRNWLMNHIKGCDIPTYGNR